MDGQNNPDRIFIVEDDSDDILLLSYELQDNQLDKGARFFSDINEIIAFHHAHERNCPPSLILLNVFMPRCDIGHAVALSKSGVELQAVPLVVMLGSEGEKEYLRSYNLDVSGYIKKPVDGQKLRRFLGCQTRH